MVCQDLKGDTMRTARKTLKIRYYKHRPGVALLYRNRVIFRGDWEACRHFAIGFGSPIDRRDYSIPQL